MSDSILLFLELDFLLGCFASAFAIVTAVVFYPYYRAMWNYRWSGEMDKDADDLIKFSLSWVDGPTRAGWLRRFLRWMW